MNKNLRIALATFCAALSIPCFAVGLSLLNNNTQPLTSQNQMQLKGEYTAMSATPLNKAQNSIDVLNDATYTAYGVEGKVSTDGKYLLIVVGIDDVKNYSALGLSVKKDGEEQVTAESTFEANKYYDSISYNGGEVVKTIADLFTGETKPNGMLVHEVEYNADLAYRVTPSFTTNDGTVLYGEMKVNKQYTAGANSATCATAGVQIFTYGNDSYQVNTPATGEHNFENRVCTNNCGTYKTTTVDEGLALEQVGDSYKVTGYTGTDPILVIPSTYNDLPVVSIKDKAFDSNTIIQKFVVEGENLTTIGVRALYGCSNLTTVVLPASLNTLGSSAFTNSHKLTSITVAEGNTTFRMEGHCLTDGATAYTAERVETIVIPEGVTTVGQYFLNMSTQTHTVYLPKSVTTIDSAAFRRSQITINYAGTETEWNVITKNGNDGDYNTWNQTDQAGNYVNVNYETIYCEHEYVDNTCTKCGGYTPSTDLTFTENGSAYTVAAYTGDDKVVVIPATYNNKPVTQIAGNAFKNNTTIQKFIVLGQNLTTVNSNAFNGATNLNTVVLPDSVTSLGYSSTFYGTAITEFTFPAGVTKFTSDHNSIFSNCQYLTTINFNNMTNIMETKTNYEYCNNLSTITVAEDNTAYKVENGCLIEKATNTVVLCDRVNDVVIPEGVTTLGYGLFNGTNNSSHDNTCEPVQTIYIPKTVTEFKNYTFRKAVLKINYAGSQDEWKAISKVADDGSNGSTLWASLTMTYNVAAPMV